MELARLETPCLLVDEERLAGNLDRMNERVTAAGARLRPHVKTAKCISIAKMTFGGGTGPIAVSTLSEAEYFASAGFYDVLYAVGMVPGRVERAARLVRGGVDLKIIVDDTDNAARIAERCRSSHITMGALIEIDCDGNRAGVSPESGRLIELATSIHREQGLELEGVLTHGGRSYAARNDDEIRAVARLEHEAVTRAARRLDEAGMPCSVVSVGSSPTARYSDSLDGVTEVRAGVYVFEDLFQVGLRVCSLDELALSVLTTVTGHRPDQGRLIVDAGALALSKDRSTGEQLRDCGYGLVAEAGSHRVLDGYVVTDVNQEHGIIERPGGDDIDFDAYPIGSRLEIFPNHACMTAAGHDRYFVMREGSVVAMWPRCNGW